jgi:hypothetical protein
MNIIYKPSITKFNLNILSLGEQTRRRKNTTSAAIACFIVLAERTHKSKFSPEVGNLAAITSVAFFVHDFFSKNKSSEIENSCFDVTIPSIPAL